MILLGVKLLLEVALNQLESLAFMRSKAMEFDLTSQEPNCFASSRS